MGSFRAVAASFILSLFYLSFASAGYYEAKIFIPKEALIFTEEGVFAFDENEIIAIATLYEDAKGEFYAYESDMESLQSKDIVGWTCSRCDYENRSWNKHCRSCGKKRDNEW